MTVTVSIKLSESNYFDMQIFVTNSWGNTIKMIGFPNDLLFFFNTNDRALLACEYPGIIINSDFLKRNAPLWVPIWKIFILTSWHFKYKKVL